MQHFGALLPSGAVLIGNRISSFIDFGAEALADRDDEIASLALL